MKVYQLVVPAHQVSSTALARAEEWIKRARQSIAKTEGISRRDLAVVGPRYMYRSRRMIGLVYRLYKSPVAEEVAVVEPKDAPEPFDPWAVEAKEV